MSVRAVTLEVIPVHVKHEIVKGESIGELVCKSGAGILDGDVIIVSQKIVSKQEGARIKLDSVIPSQLAVGVASEYEKDPRLVEVVLSESARILRISNGVIITETKHGIVCANAGVDASNVSDGYLTMLPRDPDSSAERLCRTIQEKTGRRVAVIISDTFGRPFRMGQTDCAIGIHGIVPILDYTGESDAFGRDLSITATAIADELCAAADLVRTKSSRTPIVIIRNYRFLPAAGKIGSMRRPPSQDLFR